MASVRDTAYLGWCRNEIVAAGTDQVVRADQTALGLSFPSESKRIYSAGWYFPQGAAFDLMTASLQSQDAVQKAQFRTALWSNLGYAWGVNGVSIFCLRQEWDARLEFFDDKWTTGHRPQARVGQATLVPSTSWDATVPTMGAMASRLWLGIW